MRAPRHRFSEEVRSTCRSIAARWAHEGAIAQTPDELEFWISENPEVRKSLELGGYNTKFTSHDLLPLIQAFLGQGSAAAPQAKRPHRSWKPAGLAGIALLVAILIGVLAGILA